VNPLVTVLMPVYDTPRQLLDQAVASVLAQTFTNFELLLLDDGSSDTSTLAALEYASLTDSRVRVFRQAHRGLTPALNTGLHLAAGNFIARHDADDWSEKERLERQLSFLAAHPETVIVGSAVWMHQQEGQPLWPVEFPVAPAAVDHSFWSGNPFVHGAVLFRRKDALRVGGYRDALRCSQDYDFFWRLSQGGRGANLPETLYHYRFTAGSVSAGRAAEQALAHRAARVLAAARLRGEQEDVVLALQAAGASPENSPFRSSLKQADHLMLAGSYGAAAQAYLRLLRSRPASPLAWAKLLRLGLFQTVPAARKVCFR